MGSVQDPYFVVVVPVSSVNVQVDNCIESSINCVHCVHIREELQECVFSSVVNGVDSHFERAIELRAHPVELEFC